MASFLRGISVCAAAAACVVALLTVTPLSVNAQSESVPVTDSQQCAGWPSGSISLGGRGGTNLADGQIFACPVDEQGKFLIGIQARVTWRTNYGSKSRDSASYSVCPPGGGACNSGWVPEMGSTEVRVQPTVSGAYTIQVEGFSSPQFGDDTGNLFSCRYDNKRCMPACRSCSVKTTATCFFQDPAGLAAAKAASPTQGAGGNSVVMGSAFESGVPFAASSFGASLPLQAGQKLNPRCALQSLFFHKWYRASSGEEEYVLALPTDGSDEVVVSDCSAITAGQAALLDSAQSKAPYFAYSIFMGLGTDLLCKDVLKETKLQSPRVDTAVTTYSFGGDMRATANNLDQNDPAQGSLVCGDTTKDDGGFGPVVVLPAWRSSSFSVTVAHTSAFSQCQDESCVGGNADGRCSACSYTYKVRFACDSTQAPPTKPTPVPETPSSGGGGGIIGDPQFVGLRGQSYQVHGVAGEVYNIVSSAALQYNARFVFLSSGGCPVVDGVRQRVGCYSHPGSYLGELGLKTAGESDLIRLVAGSGAEGFTSLTVNERELRVGESVLLSNGAGSVSRNSSHVASVAVGRWSFVFSNSDRFINQRVAVSGDMNQLQAHGLLGQTWRERTYPHSAVKFIQGSVDDYVIREADVFGDNFAFNAFN